MGVVTGISGNSHVTVDNGRMGTRSRRYRPAMDFGALDPFGGEPAWRQLYALLRAGVERGDFPPRTPLPSARYISEVTGLSRPTIAKAFARLRDDGLIVMVPGKGPFAAPAS